MVQANSINYYSPAKWVVSSVAGEGTHTTIASALTSASSGDTIVIMPGTYTESVTLKAGVNLSAFEAESNNAASNVIINGKCTFTGAGNVLITGLTLQTNSDFALAVTGSSASVVGLFSCYLNFSNNTGISFTSSSGSASISINSSQSNLGTTGIAYFAHSSAGNLNIRYCTFNNSGGSSTASTCSGSGSLNINYTQINAPVTISSTAAFNAFHTSFNTSAQNVTPLTNNSTTANGPVHGCNFVSGTASAISIGAGAALTLVGKNSVQSSNTNNITGAGTLTYGPIDFYGSSSGINTTTLTPVAQNAVRNPSQPCFLVRLNTTLTNKTGDSTLYTVVYDTTVYDQASNITLSGTTFTAPVTGKYLFCVQMMLSGLGALYTNMNLRIHTTARDFLADTQNPGATFQAGGNLSFGTSVIADMTAGDTAQIQIAVVGSTKTVGLLGDTSIGYNVFSGCLLC